MSTFLSSAPMHINWNITYQCNFDCEHCYSRTRIHDELSLNDKLLVVENIIRNHIFNVNLGGGEPLLSTDTYVIISALSAAHVFVNLSTNGWKCSLEIVNNLKNSGLGGIAISLDSSNEKTHDISRSKGGSFLCVMDAIEKYQHVNIPVTISTTITSKNFDELEDIIRLAAKLNCYAVDFKRLKTMGNAVERHDLVLSKEQEKLLYNKIPRWKNEYPLRINLVYGTKPIPEIDAGCPCGKTSLSIMDNGNILPCVYNEFSIGNAVKDDLGELWRNAPSLFHLRKNDSCFGLEEV